MIGTSLGWAGHADMSILCACGGGYQRHTEWGGKRKGSHQRRISGVVREAVVGVAFLHGRAAQGARAERILRGVHGC